MRTYQKIDTNFPILLYLPNSLIKRKFPNCLIPLSNKFFKSKTIVELWFYSSDFVMWIFNINAEEGFEQQQVRVWQFLFVSPWICDWESSELSSKSKLCQLNTEQIYTALQTWTMNDRLISNHKSSLCWNVQSFSNFFVPHISFMTQIELSQLQCVIYSIDKILCMMEIWIIRTNSFEKIDFNLKLKETLSNESI